MWQLSHYLELNDKFFLPKNCGKSMFSTLGMLLFNGIKGTLSFHADLLLTSVHT